MPPPRSTIPEAVVEGGGHRSWLHRATTLALTLLIVVLVLDGVGAVDAVGVDQRTQEAAGGGYALEVSAPTATRPGLATPFEVRVRHEGGFTAPVEVAVSTHLLELFDYQRQYPQPSAERTMGALTVFELDPPTGDELVMTFDWRLEPSMQSGRSGLVAVVEDESIVAEVPVHVRVWP